MDDWFEYFEVFVIEKLTIFAELPIWMSLVFNFDSQLFCNDNTLDGFPFFFCLWVQMIQCQWLLTKKNVYHFDSISFFFVVVVAFKQLRLLSYLISNRLLFSLDLLCFYFCFVEKLEKKNCVFRKIHNLICFSLTHPWSFMRMNGNCKNESILRCVFRSYQMDLYFERSCIFFSRVT